MQTAADGLLGIINDILDFSKVEAGKLQLETVDFDLGLLLDDVVALFAETAQHARSSCSCTATSASRRRCAATRPGSARCSSTSSRTR